MNYFRAISLAEEFTERALSLTSHVIRLNPNNYNVWCYRRKILRNMKYDPQKELCWTEELIRENPKNFLVWEHRRSVANSNLSYCNAENELILTHNILQIDPKSYHAWQHRQWTIQTHKFSNFGLPTSEMKFTEMMLDEDVRNNSAWNQRFIILKQRGKTDFIFVKREFFFAIRKVKLVIDNESSWNYLRGIIAAFKDVKKLNEYQEFIEYLEMEFNEKHIANRHLIAFLIDAKIEMILESFESSELIHTQKVFLLCNLMADRFDKTRRNYWKFVYKQFCFDRIKQRHESNDDADATLGGAKQDESWKQKIGKKHAEEFETNMRVELQLNKKTKKKVVFKKQENCEKATRIGTDLLFELMNKYNQ